MLLLEFVRVLFKFTLNTPALEPLFQLPPQIGKRFNPLPIESSSVSVMAVSTAG